MNEGKESVFFVSSTKKTLSAKWLKILATYNVTMIESKSTDLDLVINQTIANSTSLAEQVTILCASPAVSEPAVEFCDEAF